MPAEVSLTCRGVLCDMDGTLVDSTAVVESVWAGFSARHGVDFDAVLANSHGRPTRETVQDFAPSGADVESIVAELEAEELVRIDGIVEVPGAAAFVAGIPGDLIAIVTSAPGDLLRVRMEAAAIGLPKAQVVAADVARGKPAPDPYLRGAQLLGLAPEEIVVFEDSGAGICSALGAGMRTVVVGAYRGPDNRRAAAHRGLPRARSRRHDRRRPRSPAHAHLLGVRARRGCEMER